jgi:predicted acylesterase/phospholipase RssA/CRP-like cAMP-binding protein
MTLTQGHVSPDELLIFLRSIPLLAEVPVEDLQGLSRAFDIVRVHGGETLVRQGDPSDALFIVVHGRLRASLQGASGEAKILGEIRRRDVIGEMGVLTGAPRSASITAVRDSLLARLTIDSRSLTANPELLLALARVVVRRANPSGSAAPSQTGGMVLGLLSAGTSDDDMQSIGHRLGETLAAYGTTIRIDGRDAAARLSGPVHDENTDSLIDWLTELEEHYSIVLFQADVGDTPWTRFCRRQADRLLLVADGDHTAPVHAAQAVDSLARTDLLLLHGQATRLPRFTAQWRLAWPAVTDIWHVRRQRPADWHRLARLLTGKAIGLALGGGGARGFAHLGVLRAMDELGLPIDVVGGTSFGALVAALVAMEINWQEIHELFIEVFVKNPPQRDYTLPIVAIGAGRKLTKALQRLYGDGEIEDLWRPFLCVSTNISQASLVVHTAGPLKKWVRASLSLPGLAPPVIDNGDIFVDGCIFNNLPVDIMKERWPSNVIAVDVAEEKNMTTKTPHMDVVSGWDMLFRKLVPFMKPYDLPSFPELLQRASIVASTQALEKAKHMAAVYLQPPVNGVNVLAWGRHASLIEAGYQTALEPLAAWQANSGFSKP